MRSSILALLALAACGDNQKPAPDAGTPDWPAGALTQATMTSTVGVLLDEFPAGAERDAVAAAMIAKPDSFWTDRAKAQAKLTGVRLVFRVNYYDDPKDSLPIAPDSNWTIAKTSAATRKTVNGHDLVVADYKLTAMIVSDADSVGISEPALANVGGTWDELFTFPLDPELVFQRTRYACMDEGEFPHNSVDSEEVDSMYDDACDVELSLSLDGCHQTELAPQSCKDTIDAKIGRVDATLHFERLAYDRAMADAARIGPVTSTTGADLTGIPDQFDQQRVIYRYIEPTSCTIVEQCVGGPGWRRLLQFTGSDKNVGAMPLDIGAIDYFMDGSVASQLIDHNVYEFSTCHGHYHFMHYGTFSFGDDPHTNSKRGFCLQATNRFTNNEYGSLNNPYADCSYQGIGAGWGDEYRAGLECQWLDVTTVDTSAAPVTKQLSFTTNPDGFLCEGNLVEDAQGMLTFDPTTFTTADGKPVDKPECDYTPNYDANNTDTTPATVPQPGEGYVTQPCIHGEIGPLRNCAMKKAPAASYTFACTPGATAHLSCTVPTGAAPQVVRACDYSAVLATGIPCTDQDALANGLVPAGAATSMTLKCPDMRDANEPGGKISVYQGPGFNDDAAADVTCTIN
jgi:hypothetical protein